MDSDAVRPFAWKHLMGKKAWLIYYVHDQELQEKYCIAVQIMPLLKLPPPNVKTVISRTRNLWTRIKKLGSIITTPRSEIFFRYNLKPTAKQSYKCYKCKSTVALLIIYYLLNISLKCKEKIPLLLCDIVGIDYRMLLLFNAVQDLWMSRCSEPMQRESCLAARQKGGNSPMAL